MFETFKASMLLQLGIAGKLRPLRPESFKIPCHFGLINGKLRLNQITKSHCFVDAAISSLRSCYTYRIQCRPHRPLAQIQKTGFFPLIRTIKTVSGADGVIYFNLRVWAALWAHFFCLYIGVRSWRSTGRMMELEAYTTTKGAHK